MNNVKLYDTINAHEDRASFAISRMETIYDNRKGEVDEPHRHNYFTILILKNGAGIHKIDFNTST